MIVKLKEKGGLVIPEEMRDKVGLKTGGQVILEVEGERIIIKPSKPVSERFYRAFKVERWPEDLDEYSSEALKDWWKVRHT
jgi:AbrB family looped-hinge helix DNA binding protein